jgi:hypothetical protein
VNFWTLADQWREYLSIGALTGILAALWKLLKPRRLLSFIAAVQERETAIARATYWEAEAGREKQSGLRWKEHFDQSQEALTECDTECADCRTQLRACLRSADGSGL